MLAPRRILPQSCQLRRTATRYPRLLLPDQRRNQMVRSQIWSTRTATIPRWVSSHSSRVLVREFSSSKLSWPDRDCGAESKPGDRVSTELVGISGLRHGSSTRLSRPAAQPNKMSSRSRVSKDIAHSPSSPLFFHAALLLHISFLYHYTHQEFGVTDSTSQHALTTDV